MNRIWLVFVLSVIAHVLVSVVQGILIWLPATDDRVPDAPLILWLSAFSAALSLGLFGWRCRWYRRVSEELRSFWIMGLLWNLTVVACNAPVLFTLLLGRPSLPFALALSNLLQFGYFITVTVLFVRTLQNSRDRPGDVTGRWVTVASPGRRSPRAGSPAVGPFSRHAQARSWAVPAATAVAAIVLAHCSGLRPLAQMEIWPTGPATIAVPAHKFWVSTMSWAPGSHPAMLATSDGASVFLWRGDGLSQAAYPLPVGAGVDAISWSADGHRLLVLGNETMWEFDESLSLLLMVPRPTMADAREPLRVVFLDADTRIAASWSRSKAELDWTDLDSGVSSTSSLPCSRAGEDKSWPSNDWAITGDRRHVVGICPNAPQRNRKDSTYSLTVDVWSLEIGKAAATTIASARSIVPSHRVRDAPEVAVAASADRSVVAIALPWEIIVLRGVGGDYHETWRRHVTSCYDGQPIGLSEDGGSLVYGEAQDDRCTLVRADLDVPSASISFMTDWFDVMALSPDGKYAATGVPHAIIYPLESSSHAPVALPRSDFSQLAQCNERLAVGVTSDGIVQEIYLAPLSPGRSIYSGCDIVLGAVCAPDGGVTLACKHHLGASRDLISFDHLDSSTWLLSRMAEAVETMEGSFSSSRALDRARLAGIARSAGGEVSAWTPTRAWTWSAVESGRAMRCTWAFSTAHSPGRVCGVRSSGGRVVVAFERGLRWYDANSCAPQGEVIYYAEPRRSPAVTADISEDLSRVALIADTSSWEGDIDIVDSRTGAVTYSWRGVWIHFDRSGRYGLGRRHRKGDGSLRRVGADDRGDLEIGLEPPVQAFDPVLLLHTSTGRSVLVTESMHERSRYRLDTIKH